MGDYRYIEQGAGQANVCTLPNRPHPNVEIMQRTFSMRVSLYLWSRAEPFRRVRRDDGVFVLGIQDKVYFRHQPNADFPELHSHADIVRWNNIPNGPFPCNPQSVSPQQLGRLYRLMASWAAMRNQISHHTITVVPIQRLFNEP